MKKYILQIIASFASSLYPSNKYTVKCINNKPFIFKFTHNEGIASLLMYNVLWFFYIPFIELSDIFYTFEKDEQEFILQHEFAHYALRHHRRYCLFECDFNDMEIEADIYALIKTNKDVALRSLNKLEDICIELDLDVNARNIRERILRVEKVKIKERA